jgi:ubiquitin carboxyl-terminal hydrolase 36/42
MFLLVLFIDEEKETLLPKLKFPSKVKKANSASRAMKGRCIDQNAVRLMRSMTSTRRKGLIDCIAQQTAKHESNRCPASDPLDKKKRKLVLQY